MILEYNKSYQSDEETLHVDSHIFRVLVHNTLLKQNYWIFTIINLTSCQAHLPCHLGLLNRVISRTFLVIFSSQCNALSFF